jgi:hypothetical protein
VGVYDHSGGAEVVGAMMLHIYALKQLDIFSIEARLPGTALEALWQFKRKNY